MNTLKFFVSLALIALASSSSLFAEEIPVAMPAELIGHRGAWINKSTQTVTTYDATGKTLHHGICGTGSLFAEKNKTTGELELLDTPNSPSGKPYRIFKEDAEYVNQDGVSMPYSKFFHKGCALHGKEKFVAFKGKGLPQSHGCGSMPMPDAKLVFSQLEIGDVVVVSGSADEYFDSLGISHLFNTETAEKQEDLKLLVDLPNPTKQQIADARDAWLKGNLLVEDPNESKKRSEMFIRYPSMPLTTRMNFLKFQQIILTPAELARRAKLRVGGVKLQD